MDAFLLTAPLQALQALAWPDVPITPQSIAPMHSAAVLRRELEPQ